MKDRFGREVSYLRISVIDRCNLRCHYCMPLNVQFFDPREVLSFDEIVTVTKVANKLGIHSVRLTGGEPLVRPNLSELIRRLKNDCDLKDISLTTNGMLLERFARDLKDAGLDRINVSVDTLRPDRFRKITRLGSLQTVLYGLRRAVDVGLTPIKINVVILKGFNEDEIDDLFKLTLVERVTVRFLELMPIGEAISLNGMGSYLNLTKAKESLIQKYGLTPTEERGNGPARYWRAPGVPGKVGFITPISDKYCATCSRIRLTANGEIRPCLAYDLHVSLREAIRRGDEEAIAEGLRKAVASKPWGHHWEEGQITQTVMSSLGG